MSTEEVDFIDGFALLLNQWGMPMAAARLYAYLHMRSEPVSLDRIAADLEISKSNACGAAKALESFGSARRLTERGSKRILYVAGDKPGESLRRQTELLGKMSALIFAKKDAVTSGAANDRLGRLAQFHHDLRQAMEVTIAAA
ncbi:MAG: hypothetical protein KGL44_07735 [Sphingomonadales bacterium]|nr:hypothetical protein [Sphingomonadales bacterium]